MFYQHICFILCLFQIFYNLSIEQDIVIQKTNDKVKSVVSKNGKIESTLSDLSDLFFEIVFPEDIRYTYRVKMAKTFGSSFQKTHDRAHLVPAEPFNGCSSFTNSDDIKGNFAFLKRGDCSFLTKTINAENSGALGAIITDNDPTNDNLIDMIGDNTDRETNIPSVFLIWKDGHMIKKSLEEKNLKYAIINIPINFTDTKTKIYIRRAPWSFW